LSVLLLFTAFDYPILLRRDNKKGETKAENRTRTKNIRGKSKAVNRGRTDNTRG
jgi:hypothetical protein